MTKQQLKDLLAKNQIQKVIDELLNMTQQAEHKELHNDVVTQSGNFVQYQEDQIRDISAKTEERVSIGKIKKALLYLIDKLVETEETTMTNNELTQNLNTISAKLEATKKNKNALAHKLAAVQSLKTRRLKNSLAFEQEKIEQLEEDIEILRTDSLLSMDNVQKKGFQRRIQAKEAEIDAIISDIGHLEQQLEQLNS